jgi:large subunit ribosomal protein L13
MQGKQTEGGSSMRTTYMAKANQVERKWLLIDAEGKTLGRLASEAAALIRGKHKPQFTPHVDTGDFVIIINADKVVLTGKKLQQKKYYSHSQYPGGLKTTTAGEMLNKKPARLVELAVYGMLPKNKLGRQLQSHLKVYAGAEHPHQAQQPEVYELRG